jgi:serine/threonine-protein kinase
LVTDFGIAKAAAQAKGSGGVGPLTTEGMILGTPHYMSPEQAAGETLDPRSDLYSLGVVLYHMLSGDLPFDGDDASTVLSKHLTAAPTPIRSLRPEVPAALASVLERLLAKSPGRRYDSAADVSRALVEAVPTAAHDRTHARIPGKRRKASGRRIATAALGSVAIAFAGVFTVSAATSKAPAVTAQAPDIPDSVVTALRAIGALERGERLQLVFVPSGRTLRDALLLTDRNMVRVTRRGPRRYPTNTVGPGDLRTFHHFGLRSGLRTGVVVARAGRSDTLYTDLGLREVYELRHFLLRLGGATSQLSDPDLAI